MVIKRWCGLKKRYKINKKYNEKKINMVVLARSCHKDFAIRADKARKFIKEANENKISEEFLEKCRKASELFK